MTNDTATMNRRRFMHRLGFLSAIGIAVSLTGCSGGQSASEETGNNGDVVEQSSIAGLVVTQYRTPTCGCCHLYEEYLAERGVAVTAIEVADTTEVRTNYNIPMNMWSCHTSEVEGYFVEGHVPIEAIEKLLAERPEIDGIALPGMPIGSPGMPGEKTEPFEIYGILNGEAELFVTL